MRKKTGGSPRIFFIAIFAWIALSMLFYWIFTLHPVITRVPVVIPGQEMVIEGRRFGASQGSGMVAALTGYGQAQPLQIVSWSDTRILAKLPVSTSSGQVQVEQATLFGRQASAPHAFIIQAADLPSKPYGYTNPVQDDAPWPTFRRDPRNTGRSTLPAVYSGDQPWSFKTGKGIFSTPVIDNLGTIYFGSADHFFYALNPDGTLKWNYETGEIIDSAAALGRYQPGDGFATVTFPSGDGNLYHFRTDDGIEDAASRLVWKYPAELRPGVSFNRWFEGNVAVGYDGTLYAGNTNFNYYAIKPDGALQWTYSTGSNNWSQAAFGDDGTIYWGSNDTYIRAVSPDGKQLWRKRTLGFIAASAAIGSDGTVYVGSFDSNLYALNPQTGKVLWKFPTRDHIYSSAALGADEQGKTNAIYFGSADGMLYAVDPGGKLLWKYDTGDPVRSSPVIGLAPDGQEIVYFGCGNGRLYALNAVDGSLRWSFDTTPEDAELADRNDLNGSPALGKTGIYIGGEHGYLWYIPYDFCLKNPGDSRCRTAGSDLPQDFTGLYYVSPGGSSSKDFPQVLPAATSITLRLVVRHGGQTLDAHVCNNPVGCPNDGLAASFSPAIPFTLQHSADGRYLYIRPEGFMKAGQAYTLQVNGRYYSGGLRLGNLTLGGKQAGQFQSIFNFKADDSSQATFPLQVSAEQTSALEWTRLAAPLPPMLPSLNQIGFDYMDWILGTIIVSGNESQPPKENRLILWGVGAKRGTDGILEVDPDSDFILPLSGSYQDGDFILSNRNFRLPITGISIPFNQFELRGQFGPDLVVRPGASAYADTDVLKIPKFGPYLVMAGLANNWYQKLLVTGTYITRPYPAEGTANRAPQGISVFSLVYQAPTASTDGSVIATLRLEPGAAYPLSRHRPGILLMDASRIEAVSVDYKANLSSGVDANGNLTRVILTIPKGTQMPSRLEAYVMLDVFPLYRKVLP